MANQKLFEEAIAEAKAIREAAIANAKDALEESLTPHLKDMLAAKLQEMDSDEDEMDEAMDHEEEMDEAKHDDEDMNEAEDDAEESEDEAEDEGDDEAEEDGAEEDEDIEVKDMEVEELKDLIRDVIAQEMGGMEDQGMEDMEDMEPMDDLGDMGDMEPMGDEMEDEEEIDLDELLAELDSLTSEMDDEEDMNEYDHEHVKFCKENPDDPTCHGSYYNEGKKEEKMEGKKKDKMEGRKMKKMEEELKEAFSTINSLRKDLQEVNLLNSKLLYVNKIFKSNSLNEQQKVNIIAAFDKAETIKEVKLVYNTVADSFIKKASNRKPLREHRSFASKATGTTAKKEVINEVDEQVLRMQKLAGIIK